MWDRVGRHLSGAMEMINQLNETVAVDNPDKELIVEFPRWTDIKEKGLGAFLHDPAKADPKKVFLN